MSTAVNGLRLLSKINYSLINLLFVLRSDFSFTGKVHVRDYLFGYFLSL